MTPEQTEKKQQLVNELNRLADVIEKLADENAQLRWVIDTLIEQVTSEQEIKSCWVDYSDYTVHITWEVEHDEPTQTTKTKAKTRKRATR